MENKEEVKHFSTIMSRPIHQFEWGKVLDYFIAGSGFKKGDRIIQDQYIHGNTSKTDSADWYFYFRGYHHITEAELSEYCSNPKRIKISVSITVFKEYNFDNGDSFNLPVYGTVTGDALGNMHGSAVARNFDIWGRMKGSFVYDIKNGHYVQEAKNYAKSPGARLDDVTAVIPLPGYHTGHEKPYWL